MIPENLAEIPVQGFDRIRTVERFLASPDFPEIPPRRRSFGRGLLEPYKQSILEWWNGGIKDTKRIMFLLQRKGYTGGERTLQRYLTLFRQSRIRSC